MIELSRSFIVHAAPEKTLHFLAHPKTLLREADTVWAERDHAAGPPPAWQVGGVWKERHFEGVVRRIQHDDKSVVFEGSGDSYKGQVSFIVHGFGNDQSRVELTAFLEGQDWRSRMALKAVTLARGRIDKALSKGIEKLVKRLERRAASRA